MRKGGQNDSLSKPLLYSICSTHSELLPINNLRYGTV